KTTGTQWPALYPPQLHKNKLIIIPKPFHPVKKNVPFTIYDASAGSGKTFSLVRDYLSRLLLFDHPKAFGNILAITFTNKATAEMKTRIVDSLSSFSQISLPDNSKALFEAVKTKTNLSTEEIRKKSRLILINILHNYAAFEISTIDSFTHRILRTFAKDLNIPVNFEV